MKTHITPIRVYYEDTDAGGIVYHSNFLKFAERARCELLRELDMECSTITETIGLLFVLKHADIEYIKPAKLDEYLEVHTQLTTMRNTSFQMLQTVKKDDVEICRMTITLVCVDANAIKPIRLPDNIREKFEPYLIN